MRSVALRAVLLTAVLGAACSPAAPHGATTVVATTAEVVVAADLDGPPPTGAVAVAVPEEPIDWLGDDPWDVAARDLAALWTLPLHRTDPAGRLLPGLALSSELAVDARGWAVDVTLASGSWSDGMPVSADDVVATAAALATVRPAAWGAFVTAEALSSSRVRLVFDRPFAGWTGLLSGVPGVLPAHVLRAEGIDVWRTGPRVVGGPFRPDARTPGIEVTWEAHPGSPLGAAGLASVRTVVVPDVDLALGLLHDGTVAAVVGHLALDPPGRAGPVAGQLGPPQFGGTRVELHTVERVAALEVAGATDVEEIVDALLRAWGREPAGLLAGTSAPAGPRGGEVTAMLRLVAPRDSDMVAVLAAGVRRDLVAAGADVSLLRLPAPEDRVAADPVDLLLGVARHWPVPSAAAALARAGADPAPGLTADARGPGRVAPVGGPVRADDAWATVDALLMRAGVLGLADVAPVQAWRDEMVTGVSASPWPGLALWDVASWQAAG